MTELKSLPKFWNDKNHKNFALLFWKFTARLRDYINKLFAKVNKTKNHSFSNCDNASSFPESCKKCSLLCSLATVDSIPTDFTKNRWKFQIQICSVNSKSRPTREKQSPTSVSFWRVFPVWRRKVKTCVMWKRCFCKEYFNDIN